MFVLFIICVKAIILLLPGVLVMPSVTEDVNKITEKYNSAYYTLLNKNFWLFLKVAIQILGRKFYKILKNLPYSPKAF